MVQLEEMVFNLDRAAVEFGKMDFNTHLDLKAYSDNIKRTSHMVTNLCTKSLAT